jgi:hypothetical protein
LLQFVDPAEASAASFRALDVRPGGAELLVGTYRCDLWELNPLGTTLTATGGIGNGSGNTAATLGAGQGTMAGPMAAPGAPGAAVVAAGVAGGGGVMSLTPIAAAAADAVRHQAAAAGALGMPGAPGTALGRPGTATATATATASGTGGGGGGAPLPEPLVHGHTADVYCCAWNPVKPHQFASTCESANVYLWHAKRRLLLVGWMGRGEWGAAGWG